MSARVYLLTPPFTQLNTPYPATAYLKGFLNTKNITCFQSDLGIEVTLAIFSRKGLSEIFHRIGTSAQQFSANARRILGLQDEYLRTIEPVIGFLQGSNPTLAHLIAKREFLPEASRFSQLDDLAWAFGTMGIQDQAKHVATMYLEDISDLIKECLDDHFGFSRYAEKLGRSAGSFDALYESLGNAPTFVDEVLVDLLEARVSAFKPTLIGLSVPFPGNLYSALRCGQWIKANYPHIKVTMGGGFPNTELRSLTDPRVFEFVDFITLDDGEAPIENLVKYVSGEIAIDDLKRTFILANGVVTYVNNTNYHDYRQADVGTPDYSDFYLDKYISAIEVINPMHRLWSDGRWNKLTMAHGCYWGKCTFCDISLDYIRLYEPIAAKILCDRMETMIAQTGENGFHFVDEAAPPALMRSLAMEIIRRKLVVSWWTNVRFEKSFTRDLCLLLKASGCIAVSGGLEVASDRLLGLIQKGITVAQVARVTKSFTDAGIMVHAYLMYGFPTQTAQETVDSLEMVRQLFKAGILQSAFWHQFTMTAHSPVGLEPAKFQVVKESDIVGTFANNDIMHLDPSGADHEEYSFGLKKSLFNFMHGIGLDDPVHKWFEFKVPKTSVPANYITTSLNDDEHLTFRPAAKVIWLGKTPVREYFVQSKKGNQREMVSLNFETLRQTQVLQFPKEQGDWLAEMLPKLSVNQPRATTMQELRENYEAMGWEDFDLFWFNKPVSTMFKLGLLRF